MAREKSPGEFMTVHSISDTGYIAATRAARVRHVVWNECSKGMFGRVCTEECRGCARDEGFTAVLGCVRYGLDTLLVRNTPEKLRYYLDTGTRHSGMIGGTP